MEEPILEFSGKGYPDIRIYKEFFEVKDRDYWEYRRFYYSKVKKIELYLPRAKSFFGATYLLGRILEEYVLEIRLLDREKWKYIASRDANPDFHNIVSELIKYHKRTTPNMRYM